MNPRVLPHSTSDPYSESRILSPYRDSSLQERDSDRFVHPQAPGRGWERRDLFRPNYNSRTQGDLGLLPLLESPE